MPAKAWPSVLRRPSILVPILCVLYFLARYHSPGYLVGSVAVLAAYYGTYSAWEKVGPSPAGIGAFVIAAGLLPALGLWQYLQLRDIGDMDQGAYGNALWNFARGHVHYEFDGKNMFGIHSQYTGFFWIPVQWLGGEIGLKLGKGLCLIAAILLMLRRFRGQMRWAAWGGLALLLSPPIASQFFYGFHPEFLAAPVLVLALQAYRDQNLARFLLCTAFLSFSKESLTLAVGGLLWLALWERRSWKWVLLPGLLVCVQMAVYWFLVMPRFAPTGNQLEYFLPPTPAAFMSGWWRWRNLAYVFHVVLPFLPLMLAMPLRYFVLPVPLLAFYAGFPDPSFVALWPNYAFPLVFLCAAGLVLRDNLGIAAGTPREIDQSSSTPCLDGRVLAACAVTALLCYPLWREILSVPTGNLARGRAVDSLQAALPAEAPLVVNAPFVDRFAARREVSNWGFRQYPLEHFAYAVLDTVLPFWMHTPRQRALSVDSLSADPRWSKEYDRDGLFLFRRRDPAPAGGDPP